MAVHLESSINGASIIGQTRATSIVHELFEITSLLNFEFHSVPSSIQSKILFKRAIVAHLIELFLCKKPMTRRSRRIDWNGRYETADGRRTIVFLRPSFFSLRFAGDRVTLFEIVLVIAFQPHFTYSPSLKVLKPTGELNIAEASATVPFLPALFQLACTNTTLCIS